jgi:hypothetical protein
MEARGSSGMSIPFTTSQGIISQYIHISKKSEVTNPALSIVPQQTEGLQPLKQMTQKHIFRVFFDRFTQPWK